MISSPALVISIDIESITPILFNLFAHPIQYSKQELLLLWLEMDVPP